jgi:putative restriction endonuclease
MVSIFVAVTDWDWYDFLRTQSGIGEVNFWQPGGKTSFAALEPGELFLFKLHSPRNFIVGGGVFWYANLLPISLAWETFGSANGALSLDQMRSRVTRYRRPAVDNREDYQIGCRILEQPFFFDEDQWLPVPSSWSPNIVTGKVFRTDQSDGQALWEGVQERMYRGTGSQLSEQPAARYGEPALIRPRLGQGVFRIEVTDAYSRRCAVTRERTLPVLEAAHIVPFAAGGEHAVSNGLLLRRDLHVLFDRGYLTVSPDHHLEVSRKIREQFENGRDYYALHGRLLDVPQRLEQKPARTSLEWHNSKRYLG